MKPVSILDVDFSEVSAVEANPAFGWMPQPEKISTVSKAGKLPEDMSPEELVSAYQEQQQLINLQKTHIEYQDYLLKISGANQHLLGIKIVLDPLTGLKNRRVLDELNSSFHANPEHHRSKNPHKALLFIDLDDFGKINKQHGDAVGDKALTNLANALTQMIRNNDVAVRKGGDEFVVILSGTDVATATDTVIKRIKDTLAAGLPLEHEGGTILVKGSVGAYDYNTTLSLEDNMKPAEQEMREIKTARKLAAQQNSQPPSP